MVAAIVGLCACSLLGANAADQQSNSGGQSGSDFVIGISPFLADSVKDEVYRSLIKLVVEELPLNSTLAIYDAFELKTITKLSVPNAGVFNSPKTRANQFAPAIRDLKLFLARPHARPANAPPGFDGCIRLPQFLDVLTENLPRPHAELAVLLLGSPLYQDTKEPAFSMVEGYFPSDGHLQATREKSVFGFNGDPADVPRMILHWAYFGDPWVNELHREKVTRFWTLYLERRRTQLAAFTGDLPTALQSFQKAGGFAASAKHWSVDASQTKIEMLRISRGVELADWLTRDTLSATAPGPPSILVGPMKIGIRWKERVDLDLYARPRPGAETLFFEHVRSPEGYYYKDHRSSPGKEYEFIEFDSPVDVREVEAFVNFYKGHCPGGARGEVRIEFEGRIYGAPFSIPAEQGNLGRAGGSQDPYWTPIRIQELLKIAQPIHRAG